MPDTPDNSGADAAVDIDFDGVLAKWTDNDSSALFTTPEGDAPAAPETPSEPAPADPTPAEPPAPATPPPAAAPSLTDQQLQALSKKEAELLRVQDELKVARQSLDALRRDPVAALKALEGVDPGLIGVQLLAEDMGDAAPEEFQSAIKKRAEQARIEKLEASQKAIEQQVADAANQAAYRTQVTLLDRDLVGTVSQVPEDMPFLKRFAAKDAQEAYRGMAIVAAEAIKQGNWPSALEIARAFDKGLQADYERLAPASNPAPQAAPQETRQTPSISDADGAERPRAAVDPDTVHSDDYYQKRALQVIQQHGGLLK